MCQALNKRMWQREYGEEGKTDWADEVGKQKILYEALDSYYRKTSTLD